jgi:hypothetical protein
MLEVERANVFFSSPTNEGGLELRSSSKWCFSSSTDERGELVQRRMTPVTTPGIFDRVALRVTRAILSIGELGTESVSSALVIYCGGRKSSKVFAGCLIERARIKAGSLRSTYGSSAAAGPQERVMSSPVMVTLRRGVASADTGFKTPYFSPGAFW